MVDDSPTQSAVTVAALQDHYVCEQFADGGSLIERLMLGAELPSLILLDWMMPGLSGDEVCRFLRTQEATREVPIVMLTGARTESGDVICALECGANDIIAKPFVAAELRARVTSIVRANALKRQVELERGRLTTINQLARALYTADNEPASLLDVVARALVADLCDGCRLSLPSTGTVAVGDQFGTHEVALPFVVRNADGGEAMLFKRRGTFDADDLGAIQTCLDLSALALEAALRSLTERATTRFHQQMVGIVSHELRSPLTTLVMGLNILQHDIPAARRRELVGTLVRTSDRMTSIIDQLLDVTRARLGEGITIHRKPVDLYDCVATAVDQLQLGDAALRIELAGEPLPGHWDTNRIQQVITNLVSNAHRYGRLASPITVRVTKQDDRAVISVRNKNREEPIPPALIATLFDPFKRGDADAKRHVEGLGLGLFIVAEIVRAHGGTIDVTSDDSGTEFVAALPCSTHTDELRAPAERDGALPASGGVSGS